MHSILLPTMILLSDQLGCIVGFLYYYGDFFRCLTSCGLSIILCHCTNITDNTYHYGSQMLFLANTYPFLDLNVPDIFVSVHKPNPKNPSKVNIKSAVSALNSTSVSFGSVSSNGRMGEPVATNNGTVPVDETTKRAALAEEEAMYEKLKVGCPLRNI